MPVSTSMTIYLNLERELEMLTLRTRYQELAQDENRRTVWRLQESEEAIDTLERGASVV
jgi:hypothetical protein